MVHIESVCYVCVYIYADLAIVHGCHSEWLGCVGGMINALV